MKQLTELLRTLDQRTSRIENNQDLHAQKLEEIRIQTTKHNSRLTKIEEWSVEVKATIKTLFKLVSKNTDDRELREHDGKQAESIKESRRWWAEYLLDVVKYATPFIIGFIGYFASRSFFG